MKRLALRLSAVGVILAAGVIAIAQSQFTTRERVNANERSATAQSPGAQSPGTETPNSRPGPIPDTAVQLAGGELPPARIEDTGAMPIPPGASFSSEPAPVGPPPTALPEPYGGGDPAVGRLSDDPLPMPGGAPVGPPPSAPPPAVAMPSDSGAPNYGSYGSDDPVLGQMSDDPTPGNALRDGSPSGSRANLSSPGFENEPLPPALPEAGGGLPNPDTLAGAPGIPPGPDNSLGGGRDSDLPPSNDRPAARIDGFAPEAGLPQPSTDPGAGLPPSQPGQPAVRPGATVRVDDAPASNYGAPTGDYGPNSLPEPSEPLPAPTGRMVGVPSSTPPEALYPRDGGVAPAASPSGPGGSGEPGSRELEGAQTPSIVIQKFAPAEIQVNRPATFEIRVRNVGKTDAHQVIVMDDVPAGTRLLEASPEFARSPDGALIWQLGTLKPSDEVKLVVKLMPVNEGEIGSVAQVAFQSKASVRTICTKPALQVTHTAPERVLIGEDVPLTIRLENDGTGAATGVTVEEDVPDGLTHAAGRQLEYEIGTLKSRESRQLELTLKADKPGLIRNRIIARSDGGIVVDHVVEIEVVAPQLEVAIEGPRKRYLERQATYSVAVINRGTAPARDIELVAYMPKGLEFIETDNQGRYDAQNHAVYWSLAELPAAQKGNVSIKVRPIEMGDQKLMVQGRAAMNLTAATEKLTTVEGLAALFFQVGDSEDPLPVGAETVYEVRVTNTGSKDSTDVQLAAALPPGLKPISGDGASKVSIQGQQVIAEPLARLGPREEAVYRIRAQGVAAGDQRIRVQLLSNELDAPVLKEESTRVYSDR